MRRFIEIVYVRWIDSESGSGWTECGEFLAPLTYCHSVGFLIHQDAEKYVLANSYDPETDSANATMTIPRVAVKKVKVLGAAQINSLSQEAGG